MTDAEPIPPSRTALNEALSLSAQILCNIELSELPHSNISLKASRLARLLNDFLGARMCIGSRLPDGSLVKT